MRSGRSPILARVSEAEPLRSAGRPRRRLAWSTAVSQPSRSLASPRPLPRDRRAAGVRRRGRDQRVHGRVSGSEPRARPGRRRRPRRGLRARFQRASGEGAAGPCLAGCLDALLARPHRPRRGDRAPHAPGAADHARLRAGRARGACDRPRRVLFPIVLFIGRLRDRRRDPQLLRGVHGPGAHAGDLERRNHRLAALRRSSVRERGGAALRLRRGRARGHDPPDDHAGLVAPGSATGASARFSICATRRSSACWSSCCRSRSGSGSSTSTSSSTRSSPRGSSTRARPERHRRGLPHLHAPAGSVCRRSRDRALPSPLPPRGAWRLRRLPRDRLARPAPDRLPLAARQRRHSRPRRADRPPSLRARRVHVRADACRRGRARRVRARVDVQRDDADAHPLVLQPPVALGSDGCRAREPRAERDPRRGSSTGSVSGASRWRRHS